MIVDERMVAYINSLDVGNSALVNEIEEEALAAYVPIIRKEMQNFLKVILTYSFQFPVIYFYFRITFPVIRSISLCFYFVQ